MDTTRRRSIGVITSTGPTSPATTRPARAPTSIRTVRSRPATNGTQAFVDLFGRSPRCSISLKSDVPMLFLEVLGPEEWGIP